MAGVWRRSRSWRYALTVPAVLAAAVATTLGGGRHGAAPPGDHSTGRPVALYIHPNYSGAYACFGAGDKWGDLRYAKFAWGSTRSGYGATVNDNVASHRWLSSCGAG